MELEAARFVYYQQVQAWWEDIIGTGGERKRERW